MATAVDRSKKTLSSREDLARLRNIGIMAHIDAGKTTLTERILFHTGRIHRQGEVHDGTDHDGLPRGGARARASPSRAPATNCEWGDTSSTIIDTPGTWTSRPRWSAAARARWAVAVFDG
jgi:elongation factor G